MEEGREEGMEVLLQMEFALGALGEEEGMAVVVVVVVMVV